MLIVDEGKAREHRRQKTIERTREVTLDGSLAESRDRHWVSDKDRSVANEARQMGRRMLPAEFIKKLNTLNKDIVLEPHPGKFAPKESGFYKLNKDKAVLNLNVGGKKVFLLVCEGDYMPEWSIFDTRTVRVPDFRDPTLPWREEKIPWHVSKRGWREVLIMLIHKGVVGLEAVERVFGAGDRPSWKVLTGKGAGSIF